MNSFRIPGSEARVAKIQVGSEEFGVHDTLRDGFMSVKKTIQGHHPLEARLEEWDESIIQTRYSLLRQTFGLAEPIKRQMELFLINEAPRSPFQTCNLGRDILLGRDDSIDFEDFLGRDSYRSVDVHDAFEASM